MNRPQTVRLEGGPFHGELVTVSEMRRVFTVPVSYRRVNDDTFEWCRPPTYMGEEGDLLDWPAQQQTTIWEGICERDERPVDGTDEG